MRLFFVRIGQFVRIVWQDWVALMSGLASVVLSFWAAVYTGTLPSWTFWVAAGVCLLVAAFRAWLRERIDREKEVHGLEAKLAERDALGRPDVVLLDEVDASWQHHFRVRVKNISDVTAEQCGVMLVRSEPPLPHLPLPLHCMHLNRPTSDRVTIDPGQERKFDVLRFGSQQPGQLDLAGAVREDIVPLQKYRLTLQLHGRDMPTREKDFIFEPKPDGTFAFFVAPAGSSH